MLNSAEHENLNAHKYENIKKFSILQPGISLEIFFFLLINAKMPTISCEAELSMNFFYSLGAWFWPLKPSIIVMHLVPILAKSQIILTMSHGGKPLHLCVHESISRNLEYSISP